MDHELKTRTHAEFSNWADTYDDHWLNRVLFEPSHAAVLGELVPLQPGLALDIGCGTGELAIRLARRRWDVVGMDLCVSMLRRARSKLNGEAMRVCFATGDSERIPFAARTFGVVTCANAFHHFPDQTAAVREMARVLKPGGSLIVIDGWPDHWLGRIIFDLVVTAVEGGVWHRESSDMQKLFHAAGFLDVTQKRTYAPFPLLLTHGRAPAARTKTEADRPAPPTGSARRPPARMDAA